MTKLVEDSCECEAKKMKLETLENILTKFDFVKVLNENALNKLMIIQAVKRPDVEGAVTDDENKNAVVIFEKSHFNLEEVESFLKINNSMELYIDNDAYKKLSIYPSKPYNNVQVQLIHPATDAHISKYSQAEVFFLEETYDDWLNTTSEYIKKKSFDLTWVQNILEHKTEVERIVYEDTDKENGFVLLPDMKWDGKTIESLYLLAIVHQKSIGSLRDLNESHIKLLESIRDKAMSAIREKYGVPQSQIRAYLHYYPSFYHLHVHFTHVNFQAPGFPERNYSLNQVIQNLKIDSEYYKKASLQCVLKKNDPMFELYKAKLE